MLFVPYLCHSQILIGNFYSSDKMGDNSSLYKFKENNIFEYQESGCLGVSMQGKGHYLIKHDSLILNYDLTELQESSYHKIRTYITSKDSVQIKINIFDENKKPLNYVSVYSDKKSKISNEKGEVVFKFLSNKKDKKIIVFSMSYDVDIIVINTGLNYNIDVFLMENSIKFIKNDIIKYKIDSIAKNKIYLKRKNGKQFYLERIKNI